MNNYGYYNSYYPSTTATTASAAAGITGAILVFYIIFYVLVFAAAIVCLVALWKLFKKMGLEGWKSLLSGVNEYLLLEKIGVDQKWLLVLTLSAAIPCLGWLVLAVAAVYYLILRNVSLANAFGKSTGFAVGLILVPFVFLPMLAFGKSEYKGAKPMNDFIFGKKKA